MSTDQPSGMQPVLAGCIDFEGNVLFFESLNDALGISRLKSGRDTTAMILCKAEPSYGP
jgi:hypothetical protein